LRPCFDFFCFDFWRDTLGATVAAPFDGADGDGNGKIEVEVETGTQLVLCQPWELGFPDFE
jgi:hypothetical protein